MASASVQSFLLREVTVTPSEPPASEPSRSGQPPSAESKPSHTLREEEEFLDWSENQARSPRQRRGLDVRMFFILLIFSLILILGLVGLFRGWY